MRLCSICDKKIEGTWCKTCHRFVKTYELPSGIYLNERHDPVNDKNCTYHTDSPKASAQDHTSSGTQRAYTSTTSASASGTKETATKKKGKKTALLVVIGYILVNCIGIIGPAVGKVFDNMSERVQEEVSIDRFYEEETEISTEDEQALLDQAYRDIMLQGLTPAYQAEEELYEIRYYKPEEIRGIGYPCDSAHFDMSFKEFEMWLHANWTDSFEYADDISMYSNYCYITDEFSWVQFSCYRDYYASDDFAVRVEYDTTTEQLHATGFVAKDGCMDMELCYAMLKELDPKTEWTKEMLTEALKEAIVVGEAATLYLSESVELWFDINEEAYSIGYYPGY